MGVLIPGMEARVVREDGSEVGFNDIGELWLKGGNIVPGYFNNPQATQESLVDGWLRTGDHVRVDQEQYFLYVFRYVFFATVLNLPLGSFADRVKVRDSHD